MTSHIYLAHPIDYVSNGAGAAHIDAMIGVATSMISERGHTVYIPGKAWTLGTNGQSGAPIQQVNNVALETSGALLAVWPEGTCSIGVPMEIQYALDRGIPAYVVRGAERPAMGAALQVPGIHVFSEEALLDAVAAALTSADSAPDVGASIAYWTGPSEAAPRTGYPGDAGFYLTNVSDEPVVVPPGGLAQIPSGIAVEMPPGMWSIILGRSSTFGKVGLLVNPAVIDHGFRGPLYAVCRNITDEPVTVEPGQRVAQLVPLPLTADGLRWRHVPQLSGSDRGTAGFGSSGA